MTWFFLITLAVWRITALLVYEAGPFDLLARIRDLLGVRYDENSKCTGNVLARMLCCFKCMSVWIALAAAVLYFRNEWVVYTLAISASAIVIDRWVNG